MFLLARGFVETQVFAQNKRFLQRNRRFHLHSSEKGFWLRHFTKIIYYYYNCKMNVLYDDIFRVFNFSIRKNVDLIPISEKI